MTTNKLDFSHKAGELLFNLVRIHNFIEKDKIKCCNLTPSQAFSLLAFSNGEDLTMAEISTKLGLAPSTATRIIDNFTFVFRAFLYIIV